MIKLLMKLLEDLNYIYSGRYNYDRNLGRDLLIEEIKNKHIDSSLRLK